MSDPGPLTPEEEALVAELERELFGPLHGARQAEAAVHHDSPSLGHDSDPNPQRHATPSHARSDTRHASSSGT